MTAPSLRNGFSDLSLFFFFNDTATTEIYTLSLHEALPISLRVAHYTRDFAGVGLRGQWMCQHREQQGGKDETHAASHILEWGRRCLCVVASPCFCYSFPSLHSH